MHTAYSQKLLNAGFGLDQVGRIVTNGIKRYERRVSERMREGGRRLHLNSAETSGARRKKKLLGKTEWFKQRRGEEQTKSKPPLPEFKHPSHSASNVHIKIQQSGSSTAP